VVWLHGGATASNGCVHFPWHVTATQHSWVVTVRVDRDANFSYGSSVTDTAVGDHSVCAANFGAHGQDVTEGSGTFFTACFHDDDVVWLYGVHGLFLLVETAAVFLEQVFAVWHIAQGLGETKDLL